MQNLWSTSSESTRSFTLSLHGLPSIGNGSPSISVFLNNSLMRSLDSCAYASLVFLPANGISLVESQLAEEFEMLSSGR